MIRKAHAQDQSLIAAFLAPHITTSMFLMSNLEQHGIGQSEHPHATRYVLSFDGAHLRGLFGCTRGGYLMSQHPGLTPGDARAYLRALGSQTVESITGVSAQVDHFVAALAELGVSGRKTPSSHSFRYRWRNCPYRARCFAGPRLATATC